MHSANISILISPIPGFVEIRRSKREWRRSAHWGQRQLKWLLSPLELHDWFTQKSLPCNDPFYCAARPILFLEFTHRTPRPPRRATTRDAAPRGHTIKIHRVTRSSYEHQFERTARPRSYRKPRVVPSLTTLVHMAWLSTSPLPHWAFETTGGQI